VECSGVQFIGFGKFRFVTIQHIPYFTSRSNRTSLFFEKANHIMNMNLHLKHFSVQIVMK
jgi:hypothetical protein